MRILLVQETDWLLRGPHQQHHLAERLSLRGHELRVIDYELLWKERGKRQLFSRRQVFDDVSRFYPGAKVTVVRPGIVKIPFLDYVSLAFSHRREIHRQLEEFRPDVVVGFGILNTYLAMRAASARKVPFSYYWIDVLHRLIPFRLYGPLGAKLERMALRGASAVIVINEKLGDYVRTMGADPATVRLIRAGVDTDRFHPTRTGDAVRQQYGLGESDIVLFFMGWLYTFSGLKEVAQTLVDATDGRVKLLIVGEGDAYEELERLRQEPALRDRIILTGKKPYEEIPALIAASDICLLPAYPDEQVMHDIVPIKMYEYMAMGKPVIATRFDGLLKEFGDDNGVVYVDGPEQVSRKAVELVDGGRIAGLSAKASDFTEKCSWDSITDEFCSVLEETMRRQTNE